MSVMRTIEEIRHANLLTQIARFPTLQAFADQVERAHSQVSQLRNRIAHSTTGKPREVDSKMARHLEEKLGLEHGWMDNDHSAWPLPMIDKTRWDALDAAGRAYVQSVMALALAQIESGEATAARPIAPPIHPTAGHTLHEEHAQYGKRTGTRG